MTDIVTILRTVYQAEHVGVAADEIEALRQRVQELTMNLREAREAIMLEAADAVEQSTKVLAADDVAMLRRMARSQPAGGIHIKLTRHQARTLLYITLHHEVLNDSGRRALLAITDLVREALEKHA